MSQVTGSTKTLDEIAKDRQRVARHTALIAAASTGAGGLVGLSKELQVHRPEYGHSMSISDSGRMINHGIPSGAHRLRHGPNRLATLARNLRAPATVAGVVAGGVMGAYAGTAYGHARHAVLDRQESARRKEIKNAKRGS